MPRESRQIVVLPPGHHISGYVIESVLGTGGMGTVYLARHQLLGRHEALKLLSPELSTNDEFRARFNREASLAGSLDHPHIVKVHNCGDHDGQLWLSMQYVPGDDAAKIVARGPLEINRVLHIIASVAAALDYAHDHGLLHRDVKPANVIMAPPHRAGDPESVLLADFGIAKALDGTGDYTSPNTMLFSLPYASPERLDGKDLDRRADVYALGVMLFELLTGRVPFKEHDQVATMFAIIKKQPPWPSSINQTIPTSLDTVILRALAKEREERYATCGDLATAAERAVRAPAHNSGQYNSGQYNSGEYNSGEYNSGQYERQPYPPHPPYQLMLRKWGGVAGVDISAGPIHTAALSPVDRQHLEHLVVSSRFFDLPVNPPAGQMFDGFHYDLTVRNAERSHQVQFSSSSAVPPELYTLVSAVEQYAPSPVSRPDNGTTRHETRPPTFPPPHLPPPHFPPPQADFPPPHVPSGVAPTGSKSRAWIWVAAAVVLAVVAGGWVYLANRAPVVIAEPPRAPRTPTGINSEINGNVVTISWDAVAEADSYLLERDGEEEYAGPNLYYNDSDLGLGVDYTYTLTALNSAGISEPTTVSVNLPSPWGEPYSSIAAEFSTFLPADPQIAGYDGLTCRTNEDPPEDEILAEIYCENSKGVNVWVDLFENANDKQTFLNRWLASDADEQGEEWNGSDNQRAGMMYRTAPDDAEDAFIVTTFDEDSRQLLTVFYAWDDHSTDDLLNNWWIYLPTGN